MQAQYDARLDKLVIKGDHNNGQPRHWHITVRVGRSDGSISKRIFRPQSKCCIQDFIDNIRDAMLIEKLEDEAAEFLGFVAIAR